MRNTDGNQPVAVASTLVGNIIIGIQATQPDLPGPVIANALAIVAGAIITFIGLIRCGWIVEFIPLTAISAFMTGSAINIAVGQVPSLMGLTGFDSRAASYTVIINSLKALPKTSKDAALGLTALAMLYTIRSFCTFMSKRFPNRRKTWFFVSTLRTVFVILLYTLISWLVLRKQGSNRPFKILGSVPRGFTHAGVPRVDTSVIKAFASQLPVTVIVLLIEHIAISKSFGRVNHYTIDPSQEMVAIGVTNLLGPFLGAYPATGSFSRTAIKSKAGVRTPFAGVITAVVVLLAIYALTAVFFYIPNAALAAVIIHAVGDLITPPNTIYQFWRVSPFEVLIFFAGVLVTVFSSIENGIYTTIGISLAILLFRVVKSRGRFLGRVKIHSVRGDHQLAQRYGAIPKPSDEPDHGRAIHRDLFLPFEHQDGSNPSIDIKAPYPGIYIYRFSEGFNYPNANHYTDQLIATIFRETRRTSTETLTKLGDRPWNDAGPRHTPPSTAPDPRPTLKAVILDFSSVNNVDVTSVQNLIDVRNQLDRWTYPNHVDWHIACINNRWTRRALASGGFGTPTPPGYHDRWKPLFSVAEIGGSSSAAADAQLRARETLGEGPPARARSGPVDVEHAVGSAGGDGENASGDAIARGNSGSGTGADGENDEDYEAALSKHHTRTQVRRRMAVVQTMHLPFFHIDLTSALQSAVDSAEAKRSFEALGGAARVPKAEGAA